MNRYKTDKEYLFIINDIIENNDFRKMGEIKHHNTTRLNHSLKVSYYSYKIAKGLKLDYKDVAVGGLLHDYYIEEISECNKIRNKIRIFTVHPKDAVNNARKIVNLTEKETNIIETHMFPINYKLPKYAESWIVNFVDKLLSIEEFSMKFKYKFTYLFNLYILFMLNNIK